MKLLEFDELDRLERDGPIPGRIAWMRCARRLAARLRVLPDPYPVEERQAHDAVDPVEAEGRSSQAPTPTRVESCPFCSSQAGLIRQIEALVEKFRVEAEDCKARGYLEAWNERQVCANELRDTLSQLRSASSDQKL